MLNRQTQTGYPKAVFFILLFFIVCGLLGMHTLAVIISMSDDPFATTLSRYFWAVLVPIVIAIPGLFCCIWYGIKLHKYKKQGLSGHRLRWHKRAFGIAVISVLGLIFFPLYSFTLPYQIGENLALQRLTAEYSVNDFEQLASECMVYSVQAYQETGLFSSADQAVIEVYGHLDGVKFMKYSDGQKIEAIYAKYAHFCLAKDPDEYRVRGYMIRFSLQATSSIRQFRG